jgi:hypothetical protein
MIAGSLLRFTGISGRLRSVEKRAKETLRERRK